MSAEALAAFKGGIMDGKDIKAFGLIVLGLVFAPEGTVMFLSVVACWVMLRLFLCNLWLGVAATLSERWGIPADLPQRVAQRAKREATLVWRAVAGARLEAARRRDDAQFDAVSLALLQGTRALPAELQRKTWAFARQLYNEERAAARGLAAAADTGAAAPAMQQQHQQQQQALPRDAAELPV